MNESNILTIIILLAVFLVLVVFGLIFISRAFKNFSGHKRSVSSRFYTSGKNMRKSEK